MFLLLFSRNEETSNETSDQMKERVLLVCQLWCCNCSLFLNLLKNLKNIIIFQKKRRRRSLMLYGNVVKKTWKKQWKILEEISFHNQLICFLMNVHAELMIERLDTIKSILPLMNQEKNETSIKVLEDSIEDIQWLIMV